MSQPVSSEPSICTIQLTREDADVVASILETDESQLKVLACRAGLDITQDFQGVSFRWMDLRGQDLTGFNFDGADFTGADLRRCKITPDSFRHARLAHTTFDGQHQDWADDRDSVSTITGQKDLISGTNKAIVPEIPPNLLHALHENPENPNALSELAVFMMTVRADMDGAEALYQRAIDADPKHVPSLSNYAFFMKNFRANMDASEKLFKRAIDIAPRDERVLGNFATFMWQVRANMDAADALYKRAIDAAPKSANNLGNYAGFLLSLNRTEEGRRVLDQAMAHIGRQPPALNLELWYYAYAHFPDRREEAAVEIGRRLAAGDRSKGWDLSANVRAALPTHPEPDRLIRFAEAISGLTYRG